jgi:hypothetical protein
MFSRLDSATRNMQGMSWAGYAEIGADGMMIELNKGSGSPAHG